MLAAKSEAGRDFLGLEKYLLEVIFIESFVRLYLVIGRALGAEFTALHCAGKGHYFNGKARPCEILGNKEA
jgi:hypothetical protein